MIRIMDILNGSEPTVQLFFEVEASMERMELDRQELLKVMQESPGTKWGTLGITGRHFQVGEIMVKCDSHRFVSWMIC